MPNIKPALNKLNAKTDSFEPKFGGVTSSVKSSVITLFQAFPQKGLCFYGYNTTFGSYKLGQEGINTSVQKSISLTTEFGDFHVAPGLSLVLAVHGGDVVEYKMTTPGDVSTLINTGVSVSINQLGDYTSPRGIHVCPNGKYAVINCNSGNNYFNRCFEMKSPWDIKTLSFLDTIPFTDSNANFPIFSSSDGRYISSKQSVVSGSTAYNYASVRRFEDVNDPLTSTRPVIWYDGIYEQTCNGVVPVPEIGKMYLVGSGGLRELDMI